MSNKNKKYTHGITLLTEKGSIIIERYFNSSNDLILNEENIETIHDMIVNELVTRQGKSHNRSIKHFEDVNIRMVVYEITEPENPKKKDSRNILADYILNLGSLCPKIRYDIDVKPIISDVINKLRGPKVKVMEVA